MKITTKGNITTFVGYLVGTIAAGVGGAEAWQVIIAASALAIVFLVVTPSTIE